MANLFHAPRHRDGDRASNHRAHQFVLLCPQRIAIDDDTATAQRLGVVQVVANLCQTLRCGFAFVPDHAVQGNRWIEAQRRAVSKRAALTQPPRHQRTALSSGLVKCTSPTWYDVESLRRPIALSRCSLQKRS